MAENLRQVTDPTKAILSESALNVHDVCDYVINVATGCRHGCRFCYGSNTAVANFASTALNRCESADFEMPSVAARSSRFVCRGV